MPFSSMFLYHILLFGSSSLNFKLILMEYGLSINLKISFMNSRDKPILTEPALTLTETSLTVTNLCRFQYLADFDVKIVLLGQTSFEWITFCWVLCTLHLYWIFKSFCHCHLLLIFQFYPIELLVKSWLKVTKCPTFNLILGVKVP